MAGEISASGIIIGGIIGQRGAPGNGIVSITLTGTSGLEDTYTILYTNGQTDTFVVTNGAEGNGIVSITKTSSVGLVDTYTILYTNGSSDTIEVHNGEKGDKGDTGATGATPNLTIGSVTKGADASATITGTTDNPVLNLVLPKGDKGDKGDTGNTGATGNGIYSVTKTGTSDLVDTYTILYTNGDTQTYTITNGAKGDTGATGNGISTITKTGTAGLVDTYTITFTNGNTTTFDVTNGADGSVTDVLVDDSSVVDNGKAYISTEWIYNVLPKVSASDVESATLDNTSEKAPLKTTLKGNTSQYTTTGKNLLQPTTLTTLTDNGVTFTPVYENGLLQYINLNGNCSANTNYYINSNVSNCLVGNFTDSDTLKMIGTGTSDIRIYTNTFSQISGNNQSITSPITSPITWLCYAAINGKQYTNVKIYPMVCKSSESDDYEAFSNGSSPNPSYPQPINVVSGDNTIEINGHNLYVGSSQFSGTWNYGDKWETDSSTFNGCVVKKRKGDWYGMYKTYSIEYNKTYTYSIYAKSDEARECGLYLSNDATPNHITFNTTTEWQRYYITFTSNRTGTINPRLENTTSSGTNYTCIACPQLEEGNLTDYEKTQSYSISLGSLELCKIGDYQDYFYKTDKWYLHKEIGKVVLDGSETWNDMSGKVSFTHDITDMFNGNISQSLGKSLINQFKENADIWNDNTIQHGYLVNNQRLYIRDLDYTLAQFKTAISTNNLIVYYELATPTDTEITDNTLIGQLEALKSAVSYEGQTNINQENNDLPFKITATTLLKVSGE